MMSNLGDVLEMASGKYCTFAASQKATDMGRRFPDWMKMQRASGENYSRVKRLVQDYRLHTICTSGNCPNIGECWNAGTATFMILGDTCTRACKFCATATGRPLPPDPDEPGRLAETIRSLGLKHCVITSVDRDDLGDGGSGFWAQTILLVREANPGITIESLIPDFDGDPECLDRIISAGPDVVSHNLETVRRLTPVIRTKAKYDTSLQVLRYVAASGIRAKSGIMLGLGETDEEVLASIRDMFDTGCRIITIGQYLQPSPGHMEPVSWVSPEKFTEYGKAALDAGFEFVESSPLVRSSFHAEKHAAPREN
jgi:lipoyl synthase